MSNEELVDELIRAAQMVEGRGGQDDQVELAQIKSIVLNRMNLNSIPHNPL